MDDQVLYKIVEPQNFTEAHKQYINRQKEIINGISSQFLSLALRDVNSINIATNSVGAKLTGLNHAQEIEGMRDYDFPCEGVAKFADSYYKSDQQLLAHLSPRHTLKTLNIMNFQTGLAARNSVKELVCHHESKSILGILSHSTQMDFGIFSNHFSLVTIDILKFGALGSINIKDDVQLSNIQLSEAKLTNCEQEICFLLVLNWDLARIAAFMQTYRGGVHNYSKSALQDATNRICDKLGLPSNNLQVLKEYLFSVDFCHNMPKSLYDQMTGSSVLTPVSIH